MNLTELTRTRNRPEVFKSKELQCVARAESILLRGARHYLEETGYVEVTVPHITRATGACENIYTLFGLDYFGERAYLSQTGQLYLEVLTPFLSKVWCVGPSFRAEDRVDGRHLTEFSLLELEFKGDFDQLLSEIEGVVCSMIRELIKSEDARELGVRIEELREVSAPFKRITYSEAVELLSSEGVKWGDDLQSHHERMLVEMLGGKPLFITHYPKSIKFFNMIEDDEDPKVVRSADLILPHSGEAVGAAEREYRYHRLVERLTSSNMMKMLIERGGSPSDFDWYLNFYRDHGVQHSGCGIGVNRVTQFALASDDIRAATVYPMNKESLL
jgi:asparaginyl-tRNA synthetase